MNKLGLFLDANDDLMIDKKDVKAAFLQSDRNKSNTLDQKEFQHSTDTPLIRMCTLAATLDQQCFEIGTEPLGKKLQSLFELLDAD